MKLFIYILYLIGLSFAMNACIDNNGKQKESEHKPFLSNWFGTSTIKNISPAELINYTINSDNGLIKTKNIGEFKYSVKYKPLSYIIAAENIDSVLTEEKYEKRCSDLDGIQYFDLRLEVEKSNNEILKYNLPDFNSYESRLNYLAFTMQSDIKLIDGNDTLDCLMYHLERAYDVSPFSTVLLGFRNLKKNITEDKVFVFQDKLFNNGTIKLTFLASDLEMIPKLKI